MLLFTGMKVKVNGEETQFDTSLNLEGLLKLYKLKIDMVVIEYNRQVPVKSEYAEIFLSEGDEVEIVKFLGGG